jgi:sporulation protein YlmC with PRC-barrel domain
MRSTMTTNALEPVSKTDLGLADPNEDIRGRKVYDRDGTQFGKVDEVFIDVGERRARMISVRSGDILGIGGKRYLLPVDAITVNGDRVTVDSMVDRMSEGPQLDSGSDDMDQVNAGATASGAIAGEGWTATEGGSPIVVAVYEHYDVREPFWSPSYQRPNWG